MTILASIYKIIVKNVSDRLFFLENPDGYEEVRLCVPNIFHTLGFVLSKTDKLFILCELGELI